MPIVNPSVHEQILGEIMQGNIKDEALSWELHPDMSYTRISDSPQAFSCHQFFMTHPNLSDRGTEKLRTIVARQKKAVRREARAPEASQLQKGKKSVKRTIKKKNVKKGK